MPKFIKYFLGGGSGKADAHMIVDSLQTEDSVKK